MTVAHDTVTRWPSTSTSVATGDQTFTHTPISGSPRGVVIALAASSITPAVTGVLYGGIQMAQSAGASDTSEAGQAVIYTLKSGVPSGAQTVTMQGCTATPKFVTCSTVTAAGTSVSVQTRQVRDTTTSTNPQIAFATTAESLAYGVTHSGLPNTTDLTAIAGCTTQDAIAYGTDVARTLRRTTADAAGTVTIGWTAASDDWCMAVVALAEPDAPATPMVRSVRAGFDTVDSTTHDIGADITNANAMPGDGIVVFFSVDANPTVTATAGWTVPTPVASGTAVTGAGIWKIATSSAESLVITTSTAQMASWLVYVCKGVTTFDIGANITAAAGTDINNATWTPASGGNVERLVFATRHSDGSDLAETPPAAYWTDGTSVSHPDNANGASTQVGPEEFMGLSYNPGVWASTPAGSSTAAVGFTAGWEEARAVARTVSQYMGFI